MSMLAERRQKPHYCLQPKGKPVYNDSNNFGAKMLEKMGWSVGKGLGKNENGNQEFIRIKYKKDIKGFGYSEKDDQWTDHEKQFNSLLNSLQNSEVNSENNSGDEQTKVVGLGCQETINHVKLEISGESLEEKSKNSKARVHYKKFTRGKDLSQYSERDLANIFGKKSFANSKKREPNNKNAEGNSEIIDVDVITFNSNSFINDYFKQKIEEKNDRMKTEIDNEAACVKIDLKKRKKRKNSEGDCLSIEISKDKTNCKINSSMKKKKNKKNRLQDLDDTIALTIEENCEQSIIESKKCKGHKMKGILNYGDGLQKKSSKVFVLDKGNIEQLIDNKEINDCEKVILGQQPLKIKKCKRKFLCNNDYVEKPLESLKSEEKEVGQAVETVTKTDKKNKKKSSTNTKIEARNNTDKFSNMSGSLEKDKEKIEGVLDKYQISEYCAEKFRHTDLNGFKGSNLKDLYGYGLLKNFEIEVVKKDNCKDLIEKLYQDGFIDSALNDKYEISDSARFKKYMTKVIEARKMKTKIPDFDVTYLKKKSLFKKVKI